MVLGSPLSNTYPGSLKPDSRDPETETGNLETEKRVDRIHGTLETGLHMIPRSLVAPSRGAGGFLLGCVGAVRGVLGHHSERSGTHNGRGPQDMGASPWERPQLANIMESFEPKY